MPDAIYYDSTRTDQGMYFRTGQAWLVVPDPHSSCDENFGQLEIPVHAYHALVYLGAIDEVAQLPHLFILGAWEEGVILPPGLPEAADKLERFLDTLESRELDALIMTRVGGDPVEFRIKIDPEQVRASFRDLAAFFRKGAELGYGVQLWL